MEGISVFWHICGINYWREIAEDQIKTMESSGLLDRTDRVMVTYLGADRNDVAWLERRSKKIEVNNYSPDTRHYERMCLNGLQEWSQSNDSAVLYLHAKGVSRVRKRRNVWGWRQMLEYFTVENHERCLKKMEGADTVGGNLCICNRKSIRECQTPGHGMHYSGNFWWARTQYLRTLPKIDENARLNVNGNHYKYCEYWLLSAFPRVRCAVAFKTKGPHYYDREPEKDFRERWV